MWRVSHHPSNARKKSKSIRTLLLQFLTSCTNTVSPRMPPKNGGIATVRRHVASRRPSASHTPVHHAFIHSCIPFHFWSLCQYNHMCIQYVGFGFDWRRLFDLTAIRTWASIKTLRVLTIMDFGFVRNEKNANLDAFRHTLTPTPRRGRTSRGLEIYHNHRSS
jgi:hypothetical protein